MLKKCCFIGHRKITCNSELIERLNNIIKSLIDQENVTVFLFGSNSEFDDLCYEIVSELQKEQKEIIKKAYLCKSESAFLIGDRKKYKWIDNLISKGFSYQEYNQILKPKRVINAGKNAYIIRNEELINDSDYVIFYLDKKYNAPLRKQSKETYFYQPKSGTKIAYEYAIKKCKKIINVCL